MWGSNNSSDLLCSSERVARERDICQLGALLRPGAGRHWPRHHRGGARRQGLQEPGAQAARAWHYAFRLRPHYPQVQQNENETMKLSHKSTKRQVYQITYDLHYRHYLESRVYFDFVGWIWLLSLLMMLMSPGYWCAAWPRVSVSGAWKCLVCPAWTAIRRTRSAGWRASRGSRPGPWL